MNQLLALLLALPLSTPPQDSGSPDYLGIWQRVEETSAGGAEFWWFEETRAAQLQGGKPSFYRAEYTQASVRLEYWARYLEPTLALEDSILQVTLGSTTQSYRRVEAVPEALSVPPYDLPQDVEIEPFLLETIQLDLRERRVQDQAVRAGGQMAANAMEVDEENTAYMVELIGEFGWIGAERFGREAADAAFLLVQHSSDLRLMRTALPPIEADVRAGLLGGGSYALLHDRLQLRLGYVQRYGSQIGITPEGKSVLMPCEDFGSIDERRAELGMTPIAAYLALFEKDGEAVVRLESLQGE